MKTAYGPNGFPIAGRIDTVIATMSADVYMVDGEIEIKETGESKFHWGTQEPVTRDGQAIYVDDAGMEWLESELVWLDPHNNPEFDSITGSRYVAFSTSAFLDKRSTHNDFQRYFRRLSELQKLATDLIDQGYRAPEWLMMRFTWLLAEAHRIEREAIERGSQ